MLEKISQLAEQAATNVSRRQMLGRFGRAAAAAAAMLAGLLPSQAEAGRGWQGPCVVCYYLCPDGSSFAISRRSRGCPPKDDGCTLYFKDGCGGV
jgi:hypothetical protein